MHTQVPHCSKAFRLHSPQSADRSAVQAKEKSTPTGPMTRRGFEPAEEASAKSRAALQNHVAPHRFMPSMPGTLAASRLAPPHQNLVLQRVKFHAAGNEYDTDEIIKDPSSIRSKHSVKPALEEIIQDNRIKNRIGVKGNALQVARERDATATEIKEAQDALDAIAKSADGKKQESRDKKRKRDELERERIVDISQKTGQDEHEKGRALARFGGRRMEKIHAGALKKPKLKEAIDTLDKQTASAYDAQNDPSLLNDLSPYEAILALSQTETKRFDHKIQDTKVSIDGYDGPRDQERDSTKVSQGVHLPTVKIGIGNKSSYRHFSESATAPPKHPGHPLLAGLETLRKPESSATNFLKETQYEQGGLTHTQRFSAESPFSFMEPQKANSPYPELQKVQETSAFKVLEHGKNTIPNALLGTQVGNKEQTTPQRLFDAFTEAYQPTGTKPEKLEKKKKLTREYRRLARAATRMDIDSDEEGLSDTELGSDY